MKEVADLDLSEIAGRGRDKAKTSCLSRWPSEAFDTSILENAKHALSLCHEKPDQIKVSTPC